MKLFVIYIGGAHEKSLIELHDMRFVVANTIEETYETLRKSWWGTPTSLHLDAWGVLEYVDGHSLKISHTPPELCDNRLYFINLGGYDSQQFTELHQNVFVIAPNEVQAKHRAVQQIVQWESPHRDYLHQVDTLLDINNLLATDNYYLHIEEAFNPEPFEFTCRYTPIGK